MTTATPSKDDKIQTLLAENSRLQSLVESAKFESTQLVMPWMSKEFHTIVEEHLFFLSTLGELRQKIVDSKRQENNSSSFEEMKKLAEEGETMFQLWRRTIDSTSGHMKQLSEDLKNKVKLEPKKVTVEKLVATVPAVVKNVVEAVVAPLKAVVEKEVVEPAKVVVEEVKASPPLDAHTIELCSKLLGTFKPMNNYNVDVIPSSITLEKVGEGKYRESLLFDSAEKKPQSYTWQPSGMMTGKYRYWVEGDALKYENTENCAAKNIYRVAEGGVIMVNLTIEKKNVEVPFTMI